MTEYINSDGIHALANYRERLFTTIQDRELAQFDYKTDCGAITVNLPSIAESTSVRENVVTLSVRCFPYGEYRTHTYIGSTLLEAVQQAEVELNEWIKQAKLDLRWSMEEGV